MDAATYRDQRREILVDAQTSGQDLVRALTDLTFSFISELANGVGDAANGWGSGWSLVAIGGTGRRELCPGSDVDLLILHPRRIADRALASLSEQLWYPLWDAGLKGTPSLHTVDSAIALADREVLSAVTWLTPEHVIGDVATTAEFTNRTTARWRERAKPNLLALIAETEKRHERAGEVAFLLEPDLRDGRGGLRDMHVLDFVAQSGHDAVEESLERPLHELRDASNALLGVRAELHRATNRPSDRLLLQEQDGVARSAGFASADALMGAVSAAGRDIAWSTDETLRRLRKQLDRPRSAGPSRVVRRTADIGQSGDELVLLDSADVAGDSTLVLRLGALAAQESRPISRSSLLWLAREAPAVPVPWPERARNALVALLGAGAGGTNVLEALDRHDLVTRFLPEWAAVRSKPQRNAYHRFTVDRHLCEAAANSAELVRTVARPDLLLIGTWLHDLGKGFPGDHTEVGIELMADVGARMGFPAADVEVLCDLVRHHLLLPEIATRRDLTDPGTINAVAAAVTDVECLYLLRALTEADSLATGPTAWSDWKERLVDDLTRRTAEVLRGVTTPQTVTRSHDHLDLLDAARRSGLMEIRINRESPDVEAVAIAAPDRAGLVAALAGSLSLVGADVLSADVWTTEDGFALDVFRITRQLGGETNWRRLETIVSSAIDGTVDLESELAKRARSYARTRAKSAVQAAPPSVIVDNDTPELSTTFEVRAPDGPAVLYRVAHAISALGLDLRTAKVSTIGHEVVDTFAVRQVAADGRKTKLGDPALCETVRLAILATLS